MGIPSLTAILAAAAGAKLFQSAAIVSGTFVLEDAATLLAAMQVASGALSWPLALCSLYAGIVLGDLGLYGLGRLSANHKWAKKMVPQQRQDIGRDWVEGKVFVLVLVSRFVPGLRLPTYTTLGFLRASLLQFTLAAICATLIWTTGLFYISLRVGLLVAHYLGIWRWVGIAVFFVIMIVVGRLAAKLYAKRKSP